MCHYFAQPQVAAPQEECGLNLEEVEENLKAASHTQSIWVKSSFLKRNQSSASPCLPHKIIFKHVGKTRKKKLFIIPGILLLLEALDFSWINVERLYLNAVFKAALSLQRFTRKWDKSRHPRPRASARQGNLSSPQPNIRCGRQKCLKT